MRSGAIATPSRNGRELLYEAGDIGAENVDAQHTASVRQVMAVTYTVRGDES
jgi:hypothetical protein